ncbi:hypothetical protein K470DRAFT_201864, partial [Piedraia hortae CBS 480.64]
VNREKELDREILAWSIVHDAFSVSIFGHYAVIEGSTQSYYVHCFETFQIPDYKWRSHHFCKNIYHVWMPRHQEKIGSAINDLPV